MQQHEFGGVRTSPTDADDLQGVTPDRNMEELDKSVQRRVFQSNSPEIPASLGIPCTSSSHPRCIEH